ncbi:hypothetical protein O181_115270, partial [Austropuccinia psidii MF-1]|nr:hypothetical protein [Austropuccinia psidii MF-1]
MFRPLILPTFVQASLPDQIVYPNLPPCPLLFHHSCNRDQVIIDHNSLYSAQKPMQRSPVSIRSQTAPKAINPSSKTATHVTNPTPTIITFKIWQPSVDLVKAGCCLRLRLS